MPKAQSGEVIRQGRELVRTSKHLCGASRERIEHGKSLREDAGKKKSRADSARRRAGGSD